MKNIFNTLFSREGLGDNLPEIEWVKAVHTYSAAAFAARFSIKTAAMLAGNDIIMKAADGRFFKRHKYDKKPVWHTGTGDAEQTFRSPYLDYVLAKAVEGGMTSQPSAHDIFNMTIGPHSARYFLIWTGTDEQVANLDKTHPTAPSGFNDFQIPEDFDERAPYFAAYLRKKGFEPFRFKPAKPPAPKAKSATPS